ncbi:MAG: beta-lactamase family protein [Flavobacteriaceae bacterium]|nr:beta-lactamase family protein [Flavobacteriaceae bacterium]
MKLRNLFQSFLLLLFSLFSFYVSAQLDFGKSDLESVGFSSTKLSVLDSIMHDYVDNNDFSAIQTAIVKNGKIIHYDSYGYSEIATKKNLREDDIFRIASMTKPIVSVALMKLYEEGHFKLNDPVYKFIPEFKNFTVKKRKKQKPIKNDIKIIDLLRHSAGFGFKGPDGYKKSIEMSLEQFVKESIKTPLLYEPGTQWRYSYSTDVCGYLVEVISGMSLDVYLKTQIFDPLKMKDTFFELPKEKMDRLTTLYNKDKQGSLNIYDGSTESAFAKNITLFSGAGGLLSTTYDYLIFCQMLLNGGTFNGERIIKASTINLMLEDHAEGLKYKKLLFGKKRGFGLGFDIVKQDNTKFGSKGTFGWGGMFGTYFRIDPVEDMIYIYMTQSFETYKLKLAAKFRELVYDSLL